jgi:SAM-dependent methyltransferase
MSDPGWLYRAFDGDPAHIVDYLRWLVGERGLAEPVRVLDVGAGVGRMVAPLRALGWEVTATEPDADYRALLAEVAAAHGATVTAEAFNDLDHDGAFTLAIAVNSAFAHVLTPADRADAFRRLHAALRPGGILLLDLPNFLWILRNYRQPEPHVRTGEGREIRLVHHHEIDYGEATFTTDQEYVVAEPDGRETRTWKRHVYAMAALPDLLHLLRQAGFGELEVHGGYAARAPGRLDGPRMLITARRMPA